MKKKYYILALTFLCLFLGQLSYGITTNEGDDDEDSYQYMDDVDVLDILLEKAFANDTNSIWYFDNEGNAFASLDSGNLSGDVITNDGVYHNFETERDYIMELTNNLTDEQFENWLDSDHLLDAVTVIVDSNGHIIDKNKFSADVTHSYLAKLDELGLRDVTKDNLYTFTNGLNTFGDGFVYVGTVLTATGVLAEVGLPMMAFGSTVSDIGTFGTHGLDIYYGTFNGQNFVIDVAFWGAGEGFNLITGSEGTHTGYFYIWNEGSQEWIKFMNEKN